VKFSARNVLFELPMDFERALLPNLGWCERAAAKARLSATNLSIGRRLVLFARINHFCWFVIMLHEAKVQREDVKEGINLTVEG